MTRSKTINDSIINILDSRGTEGLPSSYSQGVTSRLETIDTGETVSTLTMRPMGDGEDFSGGPVQQLVFSNNGDIYIRKGKGRWGRLIRIVTEKNERPEEGKIYVDNSVKIDGNGSSHNPYKGIDDIKLSNGNIILYTATDIRYNELSINGISNVIVRGRKGLPRISEVRIMRGSEDTTIDGVKIDNLEILTSSKVTIKNSVIGSLMINSQCDCRVEDTTIDVLYTAGSTKVTLDNSTYNKSDIDKSSKVYIITKHIEEVK
jgi:hypothetical protein